MNSKTLNKTKISIAHSPDADDAFMFYALTNNLVDSNGFEIENILKDIQTLNEDAHTLKYDVSAVSFNAYTELDKDYQLLSCGGSLGYGYGPTIISKKGKTLKDFLNDKNKTIAIPGEKTTAFLLLQIFDSSFNHIVVPFDQIIDYVLNNDNVYGLLIHEGQLSYESHGLNLICDLGKWWLDETNLPVPLGGNIIKRTFSDDAKKQINKVIKNSIEYGLKNKETVVPAVKGYAREIEKDLSLVDKFVGMYVNDYTVDYGDEGRKAIKTLYEKAFSKGLIQKIPQLDFVQ